MKWMTKQAGAIGRTDGLTLTLKETDPPISRLQIRQRAISQIQDRLDAPQKSEQATKHANGPKLKIRVGKTWTARLPYTDATGKLHNIKRQVASKTAGNLLLKQLLRELDDGGKQALDGEKMTFNELAEQYETTRLFAPVVKNGVRLAGLKSHTIVKVYLRALQEHFGTQRIRSITHTEVERL